FAPPPAHGGGRARRRHDPHGAPRWLRRRVWPGLVPLREALGTRALPATRPGGSAAPHGRSIPPHLRGVARALASVARGLSAPRPDARALVPRVAALLLAGQAPHGTRPAAAPRRGGGREPRGVRAPSTGARGPRAGRAAPRRRHLHRESGRAVAGRDHAAI